MPLISVLGRQRQADLCEFEASVFYRATSRTARAIQKLPKKKGGVVVMVYFGDRDLTIIAQGGLFFSFPPPPKTGFFV